MHMDQEHISGGCAGSCGSCAGGCSHSSVEQAAALMNFVVNNNAAYIRELLTLADFFREAGNAVAYQQVVAAVSDYEMGSMRLKAIANSLNIR